MDFKLLYIILIVFGIIFVEICLILFRLGKAGIKEIYDHWGIPHPPYSMLSDSRTKILVLGDSTATANGADPKTSIAGRLASKFNASVLNMGKSGSRTRNLIDQLSNSGNKKFDLIVLMTGNNDIVRFTSLNKLEKDIDILLDNAKRCGKHIVLFRGGNAGNYPFHPYFLRAIYTYRSKRVREIFQKAAKTKGVIYFELFSKRKDDLFYNNQKRFYTLDLIHLNGNGYKIWFDLFIAELKRNKIKLGD